MTRARERGVLASALRVRTSSLAQDGRRCRQYRRPDNTLSEPGQLALGYRNKRRKSIARDRVPNRGSFNISVFMAKDVSDIDQQLRGRVAKRS